MLSAAQGSHTVSFTYDALGRRLTQTNPLGTIGSTWDLAGRRTRITHPGGAYFVDQDYLVTGEMAAIRENGATSGLGVVATFAYDMRGRRTALTRSNGVVTTYAYDPASRLATLGHDLAGSTLDVTSAFTHNPAGQIVANTRSNDLYSHRPAAATTFSTANGLNQLATHAGGTPAYDARGNLTAQGGRIFSYSSENLLASGTINGRTFTWTYDPLMRLYHQGLSGATPRSWLMDGNDAIVTILGTNLLAREIYGPGENELLYSIDNQNRRRWFTADERGSILSGTDETGGTSSVITYDEYGVPSALSYQHNYTGAQYLGISGLIYMRARIYDPSLGRFLQTDPIGYGDGMNMYAYVGGDAVNRRDPSGTAACITVGTMLMCPGEDGTLQPVHNGSSGDFIPAGAGAAGASHTVRTCVKWCKAPHSITDDGYITVYAPPQYAWVPANSVQHSNVAFTMGFGLDVVPFMGIGGEVGLYLDTPSLNPLSWSLGGYRSVSGGVGFNAGLGLSLGMTRGANSIEGWSTRTVAGPPGGQISLSWSNGRVDAFSLSLGGRLPSFMLGAEQTEATCFFNCRRR